MSAFVSQLPSSLVLPTRQQLISYWIRDYAIRNPAARVDPGSEPYLKACVAADAVTPLYYNASRIAKNTTRQTMVGTDLDNEAVSLGTKRLPPVGASGAVVITTNASGATIFQGDVFQIGSLVYQCTQTALYSSLAQVPIGPVLGGSVGPGTNQNPGTIGQWQIPRVGCSINATVAVQADGSGLDGGHLLESDDELRQRLDFIAANPPASGNDAEIQELASRCPGLSVEQVFTYPCALGASSTCVVFTLRATSLGATRIPNSTQLALMAAWLQAPGNMPADLSIFVGTIVSAPTAVVLEPTWAVGFPGWIDASPWPPSEATIEAPATGGAMSATYFQVVGATSAPSPGQSVALFDAPNLTFRRKKILTVAVDSGSFAGYDITVDTTNSVSDTSYVPVAGQFVCPWSDSLATLTAPMVAYMASLGPGEQFSSFPDPGSRQRRNPQSPAVWPSELAIRMIAGPTSAPIVPQGSTAPAQPPSLATLTSLLDVGIVEPELPASAPVGSPGVSAYLQTLGDLAGYPT